MFPIRLLSHLKKRKELVTNKQIRTDNYVNVGDFSCHSSIQTDFINQK